MSEHFNCCALDAAIEICFASDPVATHITPSASEDESNVRPSSAKGNEMNPTSATNDCSASDPVSTPVTPFASEDESNVLVLQRKMR